MKQQWLIVVFVAFALTALVSSTGLAQGAGAWATRAPLPQARTEVSAVELGGKIYIVGGLYKHGDQFEEYDPSRTSGAAGRRFHARCITSAWPRFAAKST